MLFSYKVINAEGVEQQGTIETTNEDTAIAALQRNGLVITSIERADKASLLDKNITWFERVSAKELVVLSRQIATLFQAQVSALRVFKMLGTEAANPVMQRMLLAVADDIQGGLSISKALAKHPRLFSSFYCNMVLAGEESGRLEQTFEHLAAYIERSHAVTSKAQHALVYPAFIIATFIGVMVLMLVYVIPKLTGMIREAGAQIPIYTRIVMGISDFFVNFGVYVFFLLAGIVAALWWYARTPSGRDYFDNLKVGIPVVGSLYRRLYLARIADNLSTMLESGIAIVQALDITAATVENVHYNRALLKAREDIKNGASISGAFSSHPEIPQIMVQMIKVGEETGELGNILQTLSRFYNREVEQAVDTMVGLIEPIMILLLAGGVGVLVASVLIPIYSVTMTIQ